MPDLQHYAFKMKVFKNELIKIENYKKLSKGKKGSCGWSWVEIPLPAWSGGSTERN